MIPWVQLDTASVPDDGGELRLMRRGAEFSIMAGSTELMNSRLSGSEEALATLACARIEERSKPAILIGGLGMGFTLRSALTLLQPDASITVAELVPAVIKWARGPLSPLYGSSLDDPRISLVEGDVRAIISAARSSFDAILLDVDNGPAGLTRPANDGLYGPRGLQEAHKALTPGGVLAVWSSAPDEGFTRRLRSAGFEAEDVGVRARGRRGARHVIWLATRARPPRV